MTDLREIKQRTGAQEASQTGDLGDLLVTRLQPSSAASAAYRSLRTNLFYSFAYGPLGVVVLTSPGAGEEKSTTCANLGVVLAQAKKNTLIVDCDFHNPTMHDFFGLSNDLGVADVMEGRNAAQEVWQETPEGLKVIPTGSVKPDPAGHLVHGRFADFLEEARKEFDHVLVDAPPMGSGSDAAILLSLQSDGVLLVLDSRKTRKESVRRSMHAFRTVGATVLGTVMTNASHSNSVL